MSNPMVFITQEPMKKNSDGNWISKGLNLAAASTYGDIHIVWPPGTSIFARSIVEEEAMSIADTYNDETDFIIALGSPSLIAILAWAIGKKGKTLRVLEWDKSLSRYYPTLNSAST